MTQRTAARALLAAATCALAVLATIKLTRLLAALVVDARAILESSAPPALPVLSVVVAMFVPLALVSPLTRVSLAARWTAGFIATATLLVLMHALGFSQPFALGFVLFAAGIGLSYSARTSPAPSLESSLIRAERGDFVLYGIALILLVAAATHVLASPLSAWDAVAFWWPKAAQLQHWAPISELTRPTYPDLGPMAWAMLSHVGGNAEPSGRIILPLAAVLSLVAISDVAPRPLRPSVVAIVGAMMLTFYGADSFTNGYQDALLAAAAGSSAIGLSLWLRTSPLERSRRGLWTPFLIAGTLGLIKSEGAIVGLVIITAFFVVLLVTTDKNKLGAALAITVGPLIGWAVVTSMWPIIVAAHQLDPLVLQEGSFTLDGLMAVPSRISERAPVILSFVIRLVGGAPMGVAFLIAAPATVAALLWLAPAADPGARTAIAFLCLAMLLHGLFIVIAFLATNAPLEWHLDTALVRLLSLMRVVMAAAAALVLFELQHIARPRVTHLS